MEFIFAPPSEEAIVEAIVSSNIYKPSWKVLDKINLYRAEIDMLRNGEGGDPAAVNFIRWLCKNDLFYLCYEILGYKDMEEPLHNDLCDFLAMVEAKEKSSLVLIPRAHFKSTVATVGRCIQWILKDQDTAIGLFSGNMKQARKFAAEIKTQLESNEVLKELFPDILYKEPKRNSKKWTADEFIVRRTEKGVMKKEGTIKIFGLLQNIPTGDHYNHLIGDDIVDQEIVGSENQMLKIDEQIQYLVPLQMTPDDPIHYVGTRYHILDSYGKMIDDPTIEVYLRKDVEGDKAIFPGRFNKEMLERTRLRIGNYKYQCQYRLDPQDPGDKKFKTNWLNYYRPFSPANLETYMSKVLVVDPASRAKKESDFTAMVVLFIDYDWNVHLVDAVHDKMNPKERMDAVFRIAKKWGIKNVVYETIGFQETDSFWINQQMPKKNHYFTVHEVSHRKQNKFDYILSTQPVFQQGRFFLPNQPIWYDRVWENPDDGLKQRVNMVEIFLNQYDLFPNLAHDDLLDAIALALRAATNGILPAPKKKPTDYTGAYKKKENENDFNPMAA